MKGLNRIEIPLKLRIIIGALFDQKLINEINSLLEISVHEVNKITSPISLEEHLKWSDIVIATSGLTKYEILRSGTPSIIVPHNELQFELNKSSAKTKAFLTISSSSIISELSEGLDTIVGERGIRLSGGQKQRISIARAVLKNSPIILLDEATSSLDSDSEEKVQNAIINLTKNKTTLVIAHRLSTIIRADKIFVLNQGKIVDFGTHNELLKNSMIYKNLYSKQLSA